MTDFHAAKAPALTQKGSNVEAKNVALGPDVSPLCAHTLIEVVSQCLNPVQEAWCSVLRDLHFNCSIVKIVPPVEP